MQVCSIGPGSTAAELVVVSIGELVTVSSKKTSVTWMSSIGGVNKLERPFLLTSSGES